LHPHLAAFTIPTAEESTKIETSVASNSGPDIFGFGSAVVPTAAVTGAFVVLTDALWNTIGGSEGKASSSRRN
jgi:ABC-type glycerol-3-phosphate transport system substrate-binding protein